MLRRPITSGSRQAPDPYDQFLESRFMYRKHTARDASCLFRVIAEQMYDTQMLHYEVRQECVRFMTRKRRIFEQHVRGDFDTYMMEMAKPKTYGTILELRALCCMYRRNVVLFEPFNLGTAVTYNESYQDNFRVFYTNDFHFDSVYTLEHIEMAAICQSISFKMLYNMLFKLPDVNFAVETMLHPQTFDWGNYEVELDTRGYIVRIVCSDGRVFSLDLPEDSKCILENYKLCNFHNSKPQSQKSHDKRSTSASSTSESSSKRDPGLGVEMLPNAMADTEGTEILHMCPNRLNSCVRQLLDDGITPFPYKVAKSLDPNMYRNVEFDSWNDVRKEAKRYNVYANDYNFKVGAKCRLELLNDAERQMHTCHIQKISTDKSYCVVYIEQFGKKLLVPYEALHPVPPDEFRPWTVPYRYQRQMQRMHMAKIAQKPKVPKWKKAKMFDAGNYFDSSKCEVVQYLHPDNCYGYPSLYNEHQNLHQQQHQQQQQQQQQQQAQPQQQQQQQADVTEPVELEQQRSHEQRFQSQDKASRPQQQVQQAPQQQQAAPPVSTTGGPGVQTAHQATMPHSQFVNYMPVSGRPGHMAPPWPGSPLAMPDEFHAGAFPGPPLTADGCMFMHFGGYAPPPPPPIPLPPSPAFATPPYMFAPPPPPLPPATSVIQPPLGTRSSCSSTSNKSCTTTTTSTAAARCNEEQAEPRRSLQMNGEDLPSDLDTLRYFYNMGVDMHVRLCQYLTPEEQFKIFGKFNNLNQFNTDQQQQQQQQQQQKERNEDSAVLAANSTPPPSPGAINPTSVAATATPTATVTATASATATATTTARMKPSQGLSSADQNADKARGRNVKRGALSKTRAKRPDQLPDLGKDHHLPHAVLLPTPTPTPSPNINGNQFNFYSTPQTHPSTPHALAPPPLAPPYFFASPKGGQQLPMQNPYAWGMPPPPPLASANMLGMPFEMMNNYSMEPNNGVSTQKPSSGGYAASRH